MIKLLLFAIFIIASSFTIYNICALYVFATERKKISVGTKSILFGAHCFFLHPWFVLAAWIKLFGIKSLSLPIFVSFFVHDLGYWGAPNMDGDEGELHPYLGARIMHYLFDKRDSRWTIFSKGEKFYTSKYWYNFSLFHSRFLAKKNGEHYSKLCVADKYAICLTPSWLYVPMATATGEIKEYMKDFENSNYTSPTFEGKRKFDSRYEWHKAVKKYVKTWIDEHKDMKQDTWTPISRKPINKEGVWE